MNTRRRRLQRLRRKHRGWKFVERGGLILDRMGIHFVYARKSNEPRVNHV